MIAVLPSRLKTSGSLLRVQARTRQSWDEAVQRVVLPGMAGSFRREQLVALLRTDHHLCRLESLDDLARAVLEDAVDALGAQRGAISLVDETGRLAAPRAVVLRIPAVAGADKALSGTVALRCLQQGESLLCRDVRADADLVLAPSVMHGAMSSILCALLRSPRRTLGVLHLDRGPLQEPFADEDLYLADALAARIAVGVESALLVEQQNERFLQTLSTLVRTVEARDSYTGSHSQRVTDYALLLAERMRLGPAEVELIRVGTPLHDIGKIAVEDAVLRKPGRLTEPEFEQMRLHPLKGVAILEGFPALRSVLPIVRSHHERWDGKGYPDGLAATAIPLIARVVAVADVFDALTSHRPYRRALSAETAFTELQRLAGYHLDPTCVRAFLDARAAVTGQLAAYQASTPTESAGPDRRG